MKPIKNYDQIKTGNYQRLPIDAYVCKILGANQETDEYGNNYIKVLLDIAEGDYTDYFLEDWKNQDREDKWWKCTYRLYEVKDDGTEKDGWNAKTLKTFTTALEECNPGYHWDWDENKWKGLKIGMVFREQLSWKQEAKGEEDPYWHNPVPARPTTIERVKTGDFKIQEPKQPKKERPAGNTAGMGTTVPGVNAFVKVEADSILDELPFK